MKSRCVTSTGTNSTGTAPQRTCIGLHIIIHNIHNNAHHKLKILYHLLHGIVAEGMSVSAAEHHGAEQYSKTGRINTQKHLSRSDLLLNTRDGFLKIPSPREAIQNHLIIKCHSQYIKVIILLNFTTFSL